MLKRKITSACARNMCSYYTCACSYRCCHHHTSASSYCCSRASSALHQRLDGVCRVSCLAFGADTCCAAGTACSAYIRSCVQQAQQNLQCAASAASCGCRMLADVYVFVAACHACANLQAHLLTWRWAVPSVAYSSCFPAIGGAPTHQLGLTGSSTVTVLDAILSYK